MWNDENTIGGGEEEGLRGKDLHASAHDRHELPCRDGIVSEEALSVHPGRLCVASFEHHRQMIRATREGGTPRGDALSQWEACVKADHVL